MISYFVDVHYCNSVIVNAWFEYFMNELCHSSCDNIMADHKACGCYRADHHDDHHSHDHTHDPGVSSVSIVCEGSLDLEKVGFTCGLFNLHAHLRITEEFYIFEITSHEHF